MFWNLLLGLPTMVICLTTQALLIRLTIHFYVHRERELNSRSLLLSVAVITGVMLLLVIGTLAQLTIWALLFWLLGEFDSIAGAVYHSAVNFTTLGYGDFVMSPEHKLLGPLESINGVLMIGVSTAMLGAAFQDAARRALRARRE